MQRLILLATLAAVFIPLACFADESSAATREKIQQIQREEREQAGISNELRNQEAAQESMSRVDRIEIYVLSTELRIVQNNPEMEKTYRVATASTESVKDGDIPFGIEGYAWQIVLNPTYRPTQKKREEVLRKTGKKLPETFPPGKNNPLGDKKIFFAFANHDFEKNNSPLGAHGTNKPSSIGFRDSDGCTRMMGGDISEVVWIILEQNGYDADAEFERARKNPRESIVLPLTDRPIIVHLKS